MLEVRRWAEIRRMREVEGLSIHEIVRRTGHDRNTVRRALRREGPPHYERPRRPSKLDAFKDEIHRLLREDARMPGKRVRELIEELGYEGSKTILDDYLREVRPLFERRRTYQRTIYRPGELLQFDLWEPRAEIPVGHGQSRRGYVVTAELGFSRAIAAALVFSKEAPDVIYGMSRCLRRLGALPETLVWDREGAIHAGGGQPTDAFAGLCGALRVGWLILEARDPEAKGALERSHRFMRTNFEPGRSFTNELDYQLQLDGWCEKVNASVHRTTRADRRAASPRGARIAWSSRRVVLRGRVPRGGPPRAPRPAAWVPEGPACLRRGRCRRRARGRDTPHDHRGGPRGAAGPRGPRRPRLPPIGGDRREGRRAIRPRPAPAVFDA